MFLVSLTTVLTSSIEKSWNRNITMSRISMCAPVNPLMPCLRFFDLMLRWIVTIESFLRWIKIYTLLMLLTYLRRLISFLLMLLILLLLHLSKLCERLHFLSWSHGWRLWFLNLQRLLIWSWSWGTMRSERFLRWWYLILLNLWIFRTEYSLHIAFIG